MAQRNNSKSFPSNSVMATVSDFFSHVDTMNETIMVPSRLQDLEVSDNATSVPPLLQEEKDMQSVYRLINTTKNTLLYGVIPGCEQVRPQRVRRDTAVDRWGGSSPHRKDSSISMTSVASDCYTDSDEDVSESSDSSSTNPAAANSIEEANVKLRSHLLGLTSCLEQLGDSAAFLTELYRQDLSK